MSEEPSTPHANDPDTVSNLIRQMEGISTELGALRQFLAGVIVLSVETDLTSELAQAQDGLLTWAAEELDLEELFNHLAEWLPPLHARPVMQTPYRPTDCQRRLFDEDA